METIMEEYYFIINPTAGGGRVTRIWTDELKPLIDDYGIDYAFEYTETPKQAIEIAKRKVEEDYEIICAVGGDGTSNEVLNGILKAKKRGIFAALPVGTGNDVSASFGIPEGDWKAAIDCLVKGGNEKVDVGYCEEFDRYFGGIASMGFDAEVADRTNRGSKNRSGTRNYQIALVQTILKFKAYNLIITVDDEDPIENEFMFVTIGNGPRYGGGMHICPDAKVTDGKLTGIAVRKVSRVTVLRLFPKVYEGKHVTHKSVKKWKGSLFALSLQLENVFFN